MLLKRFNVYASHVEFDPHGGGVNEVSAILPGATVSGQADSLGENFVALYACDGQFFLRAGAGVVICTMPVFSLSMNILPVEKPDFVR